MTRLHRKRRERAGWTDDHFLQLATRHDFFRTAWGRLSCLPDDELRAAIDDMAACWQEHESEIRAGRDREPWFAQYASTEGLERLFQEACSDPCRPKFLSGQWPRE